MTESVTRSPIELFWTAKNNFCHDLFFSSKLKYSPLCLPTTLSAAKNVAHQSKGYFKPSASQDVHVFFVWFLPHTEPVLCRLWESLWETINISICYCTRQSASVNKTKQLGCLCDMSSVYFQRFGNGADLIFALSLLTSAQSALDVLRSNIDIGKGKDICYWGRPIKKHRSDSCLSQVTWKIKFKCQICLSSLTCISCLSRVLL